MAGLDEQIDDYVESLNFWSNDCYSYAKVDGGYRLYINNQTCSTIMNNEQLLKRLKSDLDHYLFD